MAELMTLSGEVVLVDEDVRRVLPGYALYTHRSHGRTYAHVMLPDPDGGPAVKVSVHRYITGAAPDQLVDHKNNDGLNNYRSNLRIATRSQNAANQPLRHGGSSRFRGVGLMKRSGRWMAKIRVDGQERYLGTYDGQEAAARAHDRAAIQAFGEFAVLNFLRTDYDSEAVPEYKGRPRSSAYRGVSWNAKASRWQVSHTVGGATKYLGQFDSEDDAARAYDEAARGALGEHARLNFPDVDAAPAAPVRAKSSYRGVHPSGSRVKPWRTAASVDGRLRHIGNYATEEEAARAYDDVVRASPDRRKRQLNFPDAAPLTA